MFHDLLSDFCSDCTTESSCSDWSSADDMVVVDDKSNEVILFTDREVTLYSFAEVINALQSAQRLFKEHGSCCSCYQVFSPK